MTLPAIANIRTVIDIGCNAGKWTEWALNQFPSAIQVHAYEANPPLATALNKKFESERRVTIHPKAVSNIGGLVLNFYSNSADINASANLQTGVSLGNGVRASYMIGKVKTVSIDDDWYFDKLKPLAKVPPRHSVVMKIDTEGADMNVLKGAEALLSSGAVAVIQTEFNPQALYYFHPRQNETLLSFGKFFERHGFDAYLVGKPYIPINNGAYREGYDVPLTKLKSGGAFLHNSEIGVGDIMAIARDLPGYDQMVQRLCGLPAS